MTMKHFEDMNDLDIECLVSELLEEDPKLAKALKPELPPITIQPGDGNALWDLLNANRPSGKTGFHRGELNVICAGGRTR